MRHRYDLRVVVTDKAGNTTTSGGGRVGRIEQGGTIVITCSQTLWVTTLCSTWSGDFSDQALTTPGDVMVSLANGGSGAPHARSHSTRRASAGRIFATERAGPAANAFASNNAAGTTSRIAASASGGTYTIG